MRTIVITGEPMASAGLSPDRDRDVTFRVVPVDLVEAQRV
jgi:hypothetical protein